MESVFAMKSESPMVSNLYAADEPVQILNKALDRLWDYSVANPNHDTDELVRNARSSLNELCRLLLSDG